MPPEFPILIDISAQLFSAKLESFFGELASQETDLQLRWEQIYHLVAVEEQKGLDAFEEAFNANRVRRAYTACHTLADMLREQCSILSGAGTGWAGYYHGLVLFDTRQWKSAREAFESIDASELPVDFAARFALYRGLSAEVEEKWQDAIQIYTAALGRFDDDEHPDVAARQRQRIAEANFHNRDLVAAERFALASLALNEREQDDYGRALSNRIIGRIRAELGDPDQAKMHYDQALEALDAAGRGFTKAAIYTDVARLHLGQNNFVDSESSYLHAVDVKSQAGDNYGLAALYLDLGNLKTRMGEFAEALRYFERSAAIYHRFDDSRGLEKVLGNKAVALEQAGQTGAAIDTAGEAVRLARAAENAGAIIPH